jgi:hypothetical protein
MFSLHFALKMIIFVTENQKPKLNLKMIAMKKIVCLFVCLSALLSVNAQKTKAEKACVAEVRAMYQSAQNKMAENAMSKDTQNDMVVTIQSMEPAVGGQTRNYHFFFHNEYVEQLSTYMSKPYFVNCSFNVAPRKHYEEYLFDPSTTALRFAHFKWEDISGKTIEERYYFDDDDHIVWRQLQNTKESRTADDIKHDADKLINAFHLLKRDIE